MRRAGVPVLAAVVLALGLSGCGGKPKLAPIPQVKAGAEDRQVRLFDFKGTGRPDYREVLGPDGQVRYHEFDRDGDGTFREVLDRESLDPAGTKHLFLLLDGVPYSLLEQMWQEGYFRIFRRPGRMVSLFPSLTDPAYDQIFHCGMPYGYEAEFYDRRKGRKVGGAGFYLSGKNETWAAAADYRLNVIEDAVMYLYPRGVFTRELVAARKVYDRLGDRDTVVLYLLSTDGLNHMLTREQAHDYYVMLDRWIERIVYDAGGRIEITMLSDHGNNFAGATFVPIKEALQAAGLRVGDRLARSGDIVAPTFGLISFASLFCYSELERQRAVAAIMPLEGVDAIAWRDADQVRVINRHGTAAITRRGDGPGRLRYEPLDGDPLGVLPSMERMRQRGQLDADGFADEEAWFQATCDLPMPAPVQRIYDSLCCNVIHSADIVISMSDGYFYGDKAFTRFVHLRGTHGGLSAGSTNGFFMSSAFEAPACARPRDLLPIINRHFAWTPRIPGFDYAWLEQCRARQAEGSQSQPARADR